jgi:hypothetical protein
MPAERRLPPPWSVEETAACFSSAPDDAGRGAADRAEHSQAAGAAAAVVKHLRRPRLCYTVGREECMSRLIVTIAAALLGGCTVAPQPAPHAPAAADPAGTTNITRKLENQWNQCLEQSYQHWLSDQSHGTARKRTPDKNAAAEMAFQACASEEQDLDYSFIQTEAHAPSPMPHLKAETRRLLVKDGHLPIYPEQ